MVPARGILCAFAAGVIGASMYAVEKTPVFDKGEKDDFEKGVVYKPEKKIKPSNKPDTKLAIVVKCGAVSADNAMNTA